jgi:cellulose synthase/poly-beta-1,6-N-acetylglucosamine synthase-like glycosyltransferase
LGFSNKFSGVNYTPAKQQSSFLAPLPRRKKISARGVSHVQFFTLLLFCFILFLLASFYKKHKKISSLIVSIFTCLLFILARMSNPEVEVCTFKQQGGESLNNAWY